MKCFAGHVYGFAGRGMGMGPDDAVRVDEVCATNPTVCCVCSHLWNQASKCVCLTTVLSSRRFLHESLPGPLVKSLGKQETWVCESPHMVCAFYARHNGTNSPLIC